MNASYLKQRESGAALLISLIILLALTLLAVSGMQSSIFQERMSSSQREGMEALQLAERVLPDIEDGLPSANFGGQRGYYAVDSADVPSDIFRADTQQLASWNGDAVADGGGNSELFYYVEHLGTTADEQQSGNRFHLGDRYRQTSSEIQVNRVRIVIMALGPSGESRRAIEAFYTY